MCLHGLFRMPRCTSIAVHQHSFYLMLEIRCRVFGHRSLFLLLRFSFAVLRTVLTLSFSLYGPLFHLAGPGLPVRQFGLYLMPGTCSRFSGHGSLLFFPFLCFSFAVLHTVLTPSSGLRRLLFRLASPGLPVHQPGLYLMQEAAIRFPGRPAPLYFQCFICARSVFLAAAHVRELYLPLRARRQPFFTAVLYRQGFPAFRLFFRPLRSPCRCVMEFLRRFSFLGKPLRSRFPLCFIRAIPSPITYCLHARVTGCLFPLLPCRDPLG